MGDSSAAVLQLQVVPALVPLEVKTKHLQALALLPQADYLDNRIKTRLEHKIPPACLEHREVVLEDLALAAQVEAPLEHQRQQALVRIVNPKIKGRPAHPSPHIQKKTLLPIRMYIIKASLFFSLIKIFLLRN